MRILKRFFQLLLPLLLLACAGCALVLWLTGIQRDKQGDMLSSMGFLGEITGFSVRTQGEEDFPGEEGLNADELKAQLDQMVQFASDTQFNTIFFQVRPDGTVFYKTKYFEMHSSLGEAKSALGAFDPLAYLCKTAMENQVQVYALVDLLAAPGEEDFTRAMTDAGVQLLSDGRFDPSHSETLNFLARSTAELGKEYAIGGILLDGLDGLEPETVRETVRAVREQLEREATGTTLALAFDGGSSSSVTAALVETLTQEGWVDMVMPRLSAPVEAPEGEEDYAAQLERWSAAVKGAAKLVTVNQAQLLTQEGEGGYHDPEEVNYQLLLGSMSPKVSGTMLEHYGVLREDRAETEMLISYLSTPKNPLPDLSFSIPQTLAITYPAQDVSVTDSAIFLMGTSDPDQPLYLDGQEVERISSGGTWGVRVELSMGSNTFTVTQGDSSDSVAVRRYTPGVTTISGITESSLFPKYSYGVDSNAELTLSCIAPSGGQVTATVGGRSVTLSQVSATAQAGVAATFRGTITLNPDDYDPNNTQSIGKVTYVLTYGGVNTTYQSEGEVYVAGKNVQLAVENIAQLSAVLTDPDDDETIIGTLKPGAQIYVEEVVRTSRSGVMTLAYKIKGGGYILAGTPTMGPMVRVMEGAPGISMTIGDISTDLGEDGSLTLTLGTGTPAVTTTRTQDQLILDCFDTTVTGELTQFTNGFIRTASAEEMEGGTRIILNLEQEGNLWGYDLYYQDGKTILYLKPAPTRSSTFGKPLEGISVMLDAGHGGTDPGALGVAGETGPTEAQMNLAVAYAVKYRLEQLGATVSLTRSDDSYVTLFERVDAATAQKPDIFLSIHHNSGVLTGDMNQARRMECYYFEDISAPFARALMTRLPEILDRPGTEAEQARYYVTRQTTNPAVLLEVGFMVNPLEYEECTDSVKIFKTACGVAQSILDILPGGDEEAPAQGEASSQVQ
jgi:N-acetylmuramoyl-L-alanine amidase